MPMKNRNNPKTVSKRENMYKKPIGKDPIPLSFGDLVQRQLKNRKRVLTRRDNSRVKVIDEARALLNVVTGRDTEISKEEVQQPKKNGARSKDKPRNVYAKQLMLSEWLLEVPQDLIENWIMVPCPVGKRVLIVAHKGTTLAFDRRGNKVKGFYSALPGGNNHYHKYSYTVLDCVWEEEKRQFYVLDIIAWNCHSIKENDYNFRRFWLESRYAEIPDLPLRKTRLNLFPFILLPTIKLMSDQVSTKLANAIHNLPKIDGILFYHEKGIYTQSHSSLVTWLKPYMVPEVLGIDVPSEYCEKPLGYIDFNTFAEDVVVKEYNALRLQRMEVSEEEEYSDESIKSPKEDSKLTKEKSKDSTKFAKKGKRLSEGKKKSEEKIDVDPAEKIDVDPVEKIDMDIIEKSDLNPEAMEFVTVGPCSSQETYTPEKVSKCSFM